MKNVLKMLDTLQRPQLLISAARFGAADYRRQAHLQRYFGYGTPPRSGPALMHLIEIESAANNQRLDKDAGYSVSHHVDILIAMMGEARILRASHSPETQLTTVP